MRRLFLPRVAAALAVLPIALHAQISVLTWQNDNARTGLNPNETLLTRSNVNPYGFGQLFLHPLDGQSFTQPLCVPGVAIPNKGTHNVVLVATLHDTVYAFDADNSFGSNAAPLWHTSFINPPAGILPVPINVVSAPYGNCFTFATEIGIVGTPVIDGVRGVVYLVARTWEPAPPPNSGTFIQVHRLHALDVATGAERSNSPVVIEAVVPGLGDGSSNGLQRFDSSREMQRCGLLLANGIVYIAWSSYCDFDVYHGWVLAYDALTLQQLSAFNTTPNGRRGGIWMSGAAPAAAPDGSIYCVTGNGSFDGSANPTNFGDCFLKLAPTNLALLDYFAPHDQSTMNSADLDLGSGGVVVLPDALGSGLHPHLLAGCGKTGQIYLLDRDALGHFNPIADSQILQESPVYVSATGQPYFFGLPALFNGRLYFQAVNQPLRGFTVANAQFQPAPVSQSTEVTGFRGAMPAISANGTNNGIVWQVVPPSPGLGALRAYNADDLSQKLYDSYSANAQAGTHDYYSYIKFSVPTIANGKVYVIAETNLTVWGLRCLIWSISRDPVSGSTTIVFSGPSDRNNYLEASADLVHWTVLGPGTPFGIGKFSYTDPASSANPTRFYRAAAALQKERLEYSSGGSGLDP
jgi:hypothetical protein